MGCRDLLKDSDVSTLSRWSKVKDSLRSDKRYKALPSAEREATFKQYLADLWVSPFVLTCP